MHCGVEDPGSILPHLFEDANPEIHHRAPFRSGLVLHAVVFLRREGHACRVNVVDVAGHHEGVPWPQAVSLSLLDRVACQVGDLRGSGHPHGHPLDLPQNSTADVDVVVLDQVGQEFCDLGFGVALTQLGPPLRSEGEFAGSPIYSHPGVMLGDVVPSLVDSG